MLAGGLLLYLWLAFATFYFGSPVPNTAFAKLYHGTVVPDLWQNGLDYLYRSALIDPILFLLPVLSISILTFGKAIDRVFVAGAILLVAYVVSIGGDFMAGRFLSAPATLLLVLFVRTLPVGRPFFRLAAVAVLLVGVMHPRSSLLPYPALDYPSDVSVSTLDARQLHMQYTGLVPNLLGPALSQMRDYAQAVATRDTDRAVVIRGAIGFFGTYADPDIQITDRFTLVDPPRSRVLPEGGLFFRVGHASRRYPYGYLASLVCDDNRIADPDLAQMFDDYQSIMRRPLTDGDRLDALKRVLARGKTPIDIPNDLSEDPNLLRNIVHVSSDDVLEQPGRYMLGPRGLTVHFCRKPGPVSLSLNGANFERYELEIADSKGRVLSTETIKSSSDPVPLASDLDMNSRVTVRPLPDADLREVDFAYRVDGIVLNSEQTQYLTRGSREGIGSRDARAVQDAFKQCSEPSRRHRSEPEGERGLDQDGQAAGTCRQGRTMPRANPTWTLEDPRPSWARCGSVA